VQRRIVKAEPRTRILLIAAVAWALFAPLTTAGHVEEQTPGRAEGWLIPETAATERSPVPVTAAMIEKGKSFYLSKCRRCHGQDGTGRGPDADPAHAPSELTDARRASRNPDGVMFYKIWNGRANPRMPAMKSEISQADVWAIVSYIKTLRNQGPLQDKAPGGSHRRR
jgi:mono/diheme cytochrome c family protein